MFQDFVPMCVFSESNQGRNQIRSSPALHCLNARLTIYDGHLVYRPDRHDLNLSLHVKYPLMFVSTYIILVDTMTSFWCNSNLVETAKYAELFMCMAHV